jgi:hypothetical integral membrane protein (TIGR02206 family)
VNLLLADDRFHAFSGQHYLMIAITVLGAVVAGWWGRNHRGTRRELVVRRLFAAVSLLVVLAWQAYLLTPDNRSVQSSWPLGLSDVADYTAVFALWTLGRRSTAFSYYVGLTFTMMAVLFPVLTAPFPNVRWFAFWVRHIDVVWIAVYLTWGLGIRPTWRLFRTTVIALVVWAVVTYTFNVTMDANYGFLVHKPATASPLDLLGPWPWYVIGAMAVVLTVWAVLLTLPWAASSRRAAAGRDDTQLET